MGKSGTGKNAIVNELCKDPESNRIISCTTRPIRQGEEDGVDYHFMTINEFFSTEMVEKDCFNNWYYGTPVTALDPNKINVGIYTPHGVQILLHNKDIVLNTILLEAPDKIRLLRQLNREEWPNVQEIIRRYHADNIDFEKIDNLYNCQIMNDGNMTIEQIAFGIKAFLQALGKKG